MPDRKIDDADDDEQRGCDEQPHVRPAFLITICNEEPENKDNQDDGAEYEEHAPSLATGVELPGGRP